MRVSAVIIGVVVVATAGVCEAQVTQSYSYDANGRLIGVITSNGTSAHTSAYTYDDANNRVERSQTGAITWVAVSRLSADQWLQPDEALVSPDGRYSLALRPSGRLELWSSGVPTPMIAGSQSIAEAFRLTVDGQARFLPSPEIGFTPAGAWVSLRDDGGLVLLSEAGDEVWRSNAARSEATR